MRSAACTAERRELASDRRERGATIVEFLGVAVQRTRALLRDGLGGAGDRFEVDAAVSGQDVEVAARGDAPVVLPFLPRFTITASAHAFDEDAVAP